MFEKKRKKKKKGKKKGLNQKSLKDAGHPGAKK